MFHLWIPQRIFTPPRTKYYSIVIILRQVQTKIWQLIFGFPALAGVPAVSSVPTVTGNPVVVVALLLLQVLKI